MIKNMKISTIILTVIIILSNTMAFAEAGDTPSSWAKQEVQLAIENDLVPVDLTSKYSKAITRSEYTLLALKTVERNGQDIQVDDPEPFNDIEGHKYEDELIKAYNAGIISGYGNGLFKPDNKITREEIAALVVKLLKQLDEEKEIEVNNTYEYVDKDEISDWAKEYVDYCYENEILNGIAELEIAPKGQATREQSIMLLYRLAKNEDILVNYEDKTTDVSVEDNVTFSKTEDVGKPDLEKYGVDYEATKQFENVKKIWNDLETVEMTDPKDIEDGVTVENVKEYEEENE